MYQHVKERRGEKAFLRQQKSAKAFQRKQKSAAFSRFR